MTQSIKRFNFMMIALIATFSIGTFFVSCSKKDSTPPPPPADKTALQATVTAAQAVYDGTVEGTKPGQYEVGSKAALKTVLDAAKVVLADASATQTAVTNANAQLVAALATYQTHKINEIAAASLIGFWKMNGNANDSSGNNNNGTLTAGAAYFGAGTPTLTADRFGRDNMAYHFDKGGNIDIPYKPSLNSQEMSLSVWAKWSSEGRTINANSYYMIAMNRWNGYKFQLQDSHLPFYTVRAKTPAGDTTIYDRATDDGFSIPENEWTHLVVTFKSDTMSFYINGAMVKSWVPSTDKPVPGNALTLPNPVDLVIGQDLPTNAYSDVDGDANYVNWGGFWTGDLDDVMYYNVALEGPQVKSIYDNQKDL